MGAVLIVLLFAALPAHASDPESIPEGDIDKHEGVIIAVKALKGKRRELTVLSGQKELKFTLGRHTLAYELTPKNRELFAQNNKVQQIVKDANQYRQHVRELKESEFDVVMSELGQQTTKEKVTGSAPEKSERGAQTRTVEKTRGVTGVLTQSQLDFAKEEEQRRKDYGMPAKLQRDQKITIVANKAHEDTLMVLVVGTVEKKKEAISPGVGKGEEAGRKLKLAKQLLSDAESAKGPERDRLLRLAHDHLREIVKNYPESKEAAVADELLSDK
jgi:hypothetical protein